MKKTFQCPACQEIFKAHLGKAGERTLPSCPKCKLAYIAEEDLVPGRLEKIGRVVLTPFQVVLGILAYPLYLSLEILRRAWVTGRAGAGEVLIFLSPWHRRVSAVDQLREEMDRKITDARTAAAKVADNLLAELESAKAKLKVHQEGGYDPDRPSKLRLILEGQGANLNGGKKSDKIRVGERYIPVICRHKNTWYDTVTLAQCSDSYGGMLFQSRCGKGDHEAKFEGDYCLVSELWVAQIYNLRLELTNWPEPENWTIEMHIQGTKCYLETLRDASEHPKSFGDTPLIVPGGRSFECRIRKA